MCTSRPSLRALPYWAGRHVENKVINLLLLDNVFIPLYSFAMHPLDNAYEQIDGAREHLDTLKPEISAFAKEIANSISLKYKRGFVKIHGDYILVPIGTAGFPINRPAPARLTRHIGETIGSLRKALNYLVYELSRYDSKCIVDKTQFVIVDSKEYFSRQKWRLRGLTGEHIAMVERMQPYNGCNWTKLIRELSNPDKHETVAAVKHPVSISLDSSSTEAILAGENVSVDRYASIQIAFSNGFPVIETLNQFVSHVADALLLFYPEFK